MSVGLKVTYLYHVIDLIEVRITAENAAFRGSANVYVGTDGLLEAAAALEKLSSEQQGQSLQEDQPASISAAKTGRPHSV